MKFLQNRIYLKHIFCLGIVILVYHSASSQTNDTIDFKLPASDLKPELKTPDLFPTPGISILPGSKEIVMLQTLKYWQLTTPESLKNEIEFSLENSKVSLPNLGKSEEFSGTISYQPSAKITIEHSAGLLKQNTVFNPWLPNYQLFIYSSVEYSFNSWLSAYMYGQYVSESLNQNDIHDPLLFMNPLFKQTEFGSGLRAKYKNIKADVGVKSNFGSKHNSTYSKSYFNSKITVGF